MEPSPVKKVPAQYGSSPLLNSSHTSIPVRLRLSDPSDNGLQPEHFPIFPARNMLVRFASYLLRPAEPNDLMCNKRVDLPRTEEEKCIRKELFS